MRRMLAIVALLGCAGCGGTNVGDEVVVKAHGGLQILYNGQHGRVTGVHPDGRVDVMMLEGPRRDETLRLKQDEVRPANGLFR